MPSNNVSLLRRTRASEDWAVKGKLPKCSRAPRVAERRFSACHRRRKSALQPAMPAPKSAEGLLIVWNIEDLLNEELFKINVQHQRFADGRVDALEQVAAQLVLALGIDRVLHLSFGEIHDDGVANGPAEFLDFFFFMLVFDADTQARS